MRVLAIDPGNEYSGVVVVDSETYKPLDFGKVPNDQAERYLAGSNAFDVAVIEMVASYGMPVGATVFDTCVAIGRFERILDSIRVSHSRLFRREVKLHICGVVSAKDANVKAAITDRFAPGAPNGGKGYKRAPGFFYGFKSDIWQAYALAVTYIDTRVKEIKEI